MSEELPCRNISQEGIFVPGKVVVGRVEFLQFLTLSQFSTVNNEDHVTGGRKHALNVNLKNVKNWGGHKN